MPTWSSPIWRPRPGLGGGLDTDPRGRLTRPVDLEAATEQVYAATPEDFMAVRTALVAEARQAKDRELAKAIGALRKPTRSAWLINLLARSAADEVAGLLDLGEALREAQASLSGPELRRLSGERQKAVRALARRAGRWPLSTATGSPTGSSKRSVNTCRRPWPTRPWPRTYAQGG